MSDSAAYEVSFADGSLLRARVRAELPEASGLLQVSDYGAWSAERGWASWIENLTVTDCRGGRVSVREHERHAWQLPESHFGRLCLAYSVDLSHASPDSDWPDGPRTTAVYTDGSALFAIGGALFVFSDPTAPATVRWRLDPGWQVAAPWTQGETPMMLRVPQARDLVNNVLVVGDFQQRRIDRRGFEVTLVLMDHLERAIDLLPWAIERLIDGYIDLYGESALRSYLMVWFSDGTWETGESYSQSYAVATPHIPSPRTRIVWANSIAHELGHYWNGQQATSEDWAGTNWFLEGATEYLANLVLIRTGIVDLEEFLSMVQKHLVVYTHFRFRWGTPYDRISLVEAGSSKSTNNAAVYDGGWAAALCLDVSLREASGGSRGIDDLIAALAALPTGYRNTDIVDIAAGWAGEEVEDLFARFVAGTEMLDMAGCLERAGFEAVVTPYTTHVRLSPSPSITALRVRSAMLSR